ncbi:MAG: glycine betaine ABC transporter substrate-binding protein, partial [Acidimicrobiales bacterium]
MRRLCMVIALVGVVVLAAACSGDEGPATETGATEAIRIASFDFAESSLLAELYAQSLEAIGVPVARMGAVGPREIVAPALELDRIDLVPEYLGTATTFFKAAELGAIQADASLELDELLERRGLLSLDAASAEDVNAIVVSGHLAADLGLKRVSDLGPHAPDMRFGGPIECPERPLCLLGLRDVYGLEFATFKPQRSLAMTAEALTVGEIEVALMFTTSAELDVQEMVILDDDLGLQPPENVIPVIRAEALSVGEIEVALMFTTSAELDVQNMVILDDDLGLQPSENVIPVI